MYSFGGPLTPDSEEEPERVVERVRVVIDSDEHDEIDPSDNEYEITLSPILLSKDPIIGIIGCEHNVLSLCRLLYKHFELRVMPISQTTIHYSPYIVDKKWMKKKLENVISESDIIINVCSDIPKTEDMLFHVKRINNFKGKYFIETGPIKKRISYKAARHIIKRGGQYLELYVQNLSRVLFENTPILTASGPKQTFEVLQRSLLVFLADVTNITYVGKLGESFKFRNFVKMAEICNIISINQTLLLAKHLKLDENRTLQNLKQNRSLCKDLLRPKRFNEYLKDTYLDNYEMSHYLRFIKSVKMVAIARPFIEACVATLMNFYNYRFQFRSLWASLYEWANVIYQ